jgi:hypothetical protein
VAAAAIPIIMKVAPIAISAIASKFASKPGKTQQTALGGTQGAADQLSGAVPQLMQSGQALTGQGQEQLGAAGNYYGKILGGDRAEMRSAMSPEISTALDYYKGAASKTARTMKGGAKDMALAELDRSKVGNLAMMGVQARQGAAAGAERVGAQFFGAGGQQTGQGIQAGANAGYLNNALFNQGTQVQDRARQTGASFGKLAFDLLGAYAGGGMKKPTLPSFGPSGGYPTMGLPSITPNRP